MATLVRLAIGNPPSVITWFAGDVYYGPVCRMVGRWPGFQGRTDTLSDFMAGLFPLRLRLQSPEARMEGQKRAHDRLAPIGKRRLLQQYVFQHAQEVPRSLELPVPACVIESIPDPVAEAALVKGGIRPRKSMDSHMRPLE